MAFKIADSPDDATERRETTVFSFIVIWHATCGRGSSAPVSHIVRSSSNLVSFYFADCVTSKLYEYSSIQLSARLAIISKHSASVPQTFLLTNWDIALQG